ncbi:MAG: nuclear transport factor 2 family protein [Hyphomonadaceae bacterium]
MSFDPTNIGSVIERMYAIISGPAGPRDWAAQKQIFHPEARQMRTGVDERGAPWIKIMSVEDYAENTAPFFAVTDFYEVETARRIDVLGNIAHVWSVYEARNAPGDATPERRGVNSIQLYRGEDGRWRIISMIWDNERDGVKIAPF